jgi:hypothetical protein
VVCCKGGLFCAEVLIPSSPKKNQWSPEGKASLCIGKIGGRYLLIAYLFFRNHPVAFISFAFWQSELCNVTKIIY